MIRNEQTSFVIFFGIIICAVIVGYNAFYNPPAQEVEYIPMTSEEISESESVDDAQEMSEFINDGHYVNGKLNINLATVDELMNLDGIGEALAQRIIDYRSAIGEFRDISELMNVVGIGESKYEAIKDKIFI